MIKNFYIFRNGQSSHNYIGKLQGQNNNSVLTDEGINQALLAADHLKDKNIDIVISSPQRRAKQTGSIVAKKIKAPIHYDSRLVELNLGDVEGMNLQKLSPKQLDILHQWYNNSSNDNIHFKNGESKIELRKRIREALNEYTSKEYNNVNVFAVFVGGVKVKEGRTILDENKVLNSISLAIVLIVYLIKNIPLKILREYVKF